MVMRRLSILNVGAEPGPSGTRNSVLISLRSVRNGVVALQKWAAMWNSGRTCSYTSGLWTAGLSIPIDCGERPSTLTGRKLRPITLVESLVKFAEAVGLDELTEEIRKYMEPMQLGVGTPDGNIVLLRVLQSWANDIEVESSRAGQD